VGVRAVVVLFVLFLRMVVWQPFRPCWRLIIARVAEVHVAYHMRTELWVTSSSERTKTQAPLLYLQFTKTYLNHCKSGS
jgi:hypothetical protein